MPPSGREAISDFLAQKRIAVVGVSRKTGDFNRTLFEDLKKQGYDAVPVNPNAKDIGGVPCYESVQDVEPPVDAVLVMVPPNVADTVVKDCAKAGVKRVWFYRATGQGAVSPAALDFCEKNGMSVVPGQCPYMFLKGAAWFHRLHGAIWKILGKYPA